MRMYIYCTFMLLQLYLFKELGDENLAVAIGEKWDPIYYIIIIIVQVVMKSSVDVYTCTYFSTHIYVHIVYSCSTGGFC